MKFVRENCGRHRIFNVVVLFCALNIFVQCALAKEGPNEILNREGAKGKIDCPSSAVKRVRNVPSNIALVHAGLIFIAQGRQEKSLACLTKAVKADPNNDLAWSALAHLIRLRGGQGADTLFEHAAKISKFSAPYVPVWEVLGPFSIGKGEVDGDPLEAPKLGGIDSIKRAKGSFPSEYAEGGFITWEVRAFDSVPWISQLFIKIIRDPLPKRRSAVAM
jgi:hypothetical protein